MTMEKDYSRLIASCSFFLMQYKLPCYLRTCRRKWCLTQVELAQLLGLKTAQHVSRLERGTRHPSIAVLFRIEVLFGEQPSVLFRHMFEVIEEQTMIQVYALEQSVEGATNRALLRKGEFAREVLHRAVTRSHKHTGHEA